MIAVRRAEAGDAALIVRLNADVQAIHAEALPHWFKAAGEFRLEGAEGMISAPEDRVFIAEADGEPAGYAYMEFRSEPDNELSFARTIAHLHHLSVRPQFRRHGVGHALMDAVRAEAKAAGTATIMLSVWRFNENARAFFAREGFEVFNERMWNRS